MLPDTINFHFTSSCNANCHFCFAKYEEVTSPSKTYDFLKIIEAIGMQSEQDGLQRRINFVGGEPTIHKSLPKLLRHAKAQGLKTSIVTNGLTLLDGEIPDYLELLDMVGLSIDSVDPHVVKASGRYDRKTMYIPTLQDWSNLAVRLKSFDVTLKINTVVHRKNCKENLASLISQLSPSKWKIFQVTRVEGQNDSEFEEWAITEEEFQEFCDSHNHVLQQGVSIVQETSNLMLNSYAMIGPHGCFVDSSSGRYFQSSSILDVGVEQAWSEIRFDHSAFAVRRGLSQDVREGVHV